MSSRKVIDIANSLEFVSDYNTSGITGNNARISTSENGELYLYNGTVSQNSTTGTIVLYNGGLSINNTSDSESYTSGGAITIRGGGSIEKNFHIGSNLYVLDTISSGKLVTSDFTTGNINFTGNLYQNGSLYISSQWYSGTGGNLSYTDGNVGIGTTAPAFTLDVNGSIRSTNTISTNSTITTLNVTGLTAGNINFTGSLFQNGSLYISSQWLSGTGGNLSYTGGNVGIGTTAPNSTLDISGNLSISGSSNLSTISVNGSSNVLSIRNISASGNSAIQFQNNSGNSKLYIGFANANSSITNFVGTSYILSEGATSIKIAAGNLTAVPVIINANDNSVSITTTTDATDRYSGSLKVAGGAGIANSLYVGDDVHVNRDLYVNGAINGAAASSSTFAYLTLTATDDAMNLSTGSLITFGGITIQSTAEAQSVTNGGSFLTEGGASIGRTLYVGDKIITDLVTTTNLVVDTVTSGTIATSTVNLGICNMYSGSFTPSNNNTIAADVVGLAFNNVDVRSFTVTLTASITATSSLSETFVLEAVQIDSGWDFYTSSYGDSTDIAFSITNSGQIQYTTPNFPGFSNATFRYQVTAINKTGSYVYPGSASQSTLISNTIQILSTEDSDIGTNNGALYIMGGCTIDKTMYSNKISSGEIRVTSASIGSLSIGSNLSVAGTITTLNITTTNLVDTNVSVGTLNATNMNSSTLNLSIGMTAASAQITNSNVTTQTVGTSLVSNVSATTITAATLLNTNAVSTNISSATLNLSTGITAASAQITNSNVTTQTVGTSRITIALLALGNSNTLGNIFTTGGNVGIGTVNPTSKLHVLGDINVNDWGHRIGFAVNDGFVFMNKTIGNYAISWDITTDGAAAAHLSGWGGINFFTQTNHRMIIDRNGNVGIGTTSPTSRLYISDSTSNPFSLILDGTSKTTNNGIIINAATGYIPFINFLVNGSGPNIAATATQLQLTQSASHTTSINPNGGLVCINTTSALSSLNNSLNVPSIQVGNRSDRSWIINLGGSGTLDSRRAGLFYGDGTNMFIMNQEPGYMIFGTNNTDRMIITSAGFVGIGTNNPSSRLHVHNDLNSEHSVRISNPNTGSNGFSALRIGNSVNDAILFLNSSNRTDDGGANTFTIRNDAGPLRLQGGGAFNTLWLSTGGNIGIGTTNPSYGLHVASFGASGSIPGFAGWYNQYGWQNQTVGYNVGIYSQYFIMSGEGFVSVSDQRIKKDITDIDDSEALNLIRQIEPKRYRYIDEYKRGTHYVYGFIAQQVRSVLPYASGLVKDFIPSIMTPGTVMYDLETDISTVTLVDDKFHNLTSENIGSQIRFFDNANNQKDLILVEIVSTKVFRVKGELDTVNSTFVYGVYVEDFHTLNKDAVFTVALAALQEVDRELQNEKIQHNQTKEKLQNLTEVVENMMAKLRTKYPDEF
jgi:hypothetical protein